MAKTLTNKKKNSVKAARKQSAVERKPAQQRASDPRPRANDRNGRTGGADQTTTRTGTFVLLESGFGTLRDPQNAYLPSPHDVYVARSQVQRFGLRTGMTVSGPVRPPAKNERHPALVRIESINGREPESLDADRPLFEELTSLHPTERLILETGPAEIGLRVLDLLVPIGKGQRGLIVSPPRAGKTMLLQSIARAVLKNHPECHLFILLVDERPEEVTEMRREVYGPNVEIAGSTFDRPPEEQTQVARILLEKAKRLVEEGRDTVILLDSLTRLARAHNALMSSGAKTLSGGVAVGALEEPKRFFGAARNVEEGGSLTILATALVDTGSRMDQVIFEEFKGTGNMEVHLDRRLVDRRIWPAVNVNASGTRREELLLDPDELPLVHALRRTLATRDPVEAIDLLTRGLRRTGSNAEFLLAMPA